MWLLVRGARTSLCSIAEAVWSRTTLARVEVDVVPADPEGLASPASCCGEEQPGGLVTILVHEVEEPGERRCVPHLHLG